MSSKPLRSDADQRLRELMLYVADRCDQHLRFGNVKLNKILFYSDFVAYVRLGKPITGAVYQRLRQGPAPRRLLPAKKRLVQDGHAVEREKQVYAYTQKRLVPLRPADLDLFTAHEIAIVDEVIAALETMSADAVSELSHQFPGWELADDNETIPYFSALLPSDDWQPDQEILDHAATLAARL